MLILKDGGNVGRESRGFFIHAIVILLGYVSLQLFRAVLPTLCFGQIFQPSKSNLAWSPGYCPHKWCFVLLRLCIIRCEMGQRRCALKTAVLRPSHLQSICIP